MTVRNILVPICAGVPFEAQLEAALALSHKLEAHINAVYLRPDPVETVAAIPEVAVAAGVTVAGIQRAESEAEAAAQSRFEAWRSAHGLACEMIDQSLRTIYACWSRRIGPVEVNLLRSGRLSDLIVLNYPDSYAPYTGQAFDTAVFDTGRPTILVREKVPDDLLRHVLIAWNGSLEATRAVAAAMTLFHEAEQISIFTVSPDTADSMEGLDLRDAFAWHGIRARQLPSATDGSSVGATLLRAASEHDATLLVMGAYTHSRIRQILLGGVTAHVLRHGTIPVLMMH